MTDIVGLTSAFQYHAAASSVHPITLVCDQISCVTENIRRVSKMRSPDPILLEVLIDNLHDHVLVLRELNGGGECE